MKSSRFNGRMALCAASCAVFAIVPGCGNGFLGLQDYQRDLILGGLAVALLNQQPQGGGVGQPIPGADGLNCWDLNGNGLGDPGEDANGDGLFDALDCQGVAGSPGQDGTDATGDGAGANGDHCWDLNGNGTPDTAEDTNGDGSVDVLDCRGQDGANGGSGSPGRPGPEFFDVFIDDFFKAFGTADGALPVVAVRVTEPALGGGGVASDEGMSAGTGPSTNDAIAYRVAIPSRYAAGNDVVMRLMFYRTGFLDGDCFIFSVDARRLRNGSGVEVYDAHAPDVATCGANPSAPGCGRRWIRINQPDTNGAAAGEVPSTGSFIVIDLPLNTPAGLDYPNDLAGGDLLAFELATNLRDGRLYELLGVEFIELPRNGGATSGAGVIFSEDAICCANVSTSPGDRVPDDHLFISDGEMLRVTNIADLAAVRDLPGSLSSSGGYDDGRHMVFDSFSQRIFVSNHDRDFDVFDTSLNPLSVVWGISVSEPLGMAPLPDGKLLITDEEDSTGLFRINADLTFDAEAFGAYSLDGAEGVAFDSVHNRIFMADEDDGDIEIFDGSSLEHLGLATTSCGSEGPYWISVDGSTSRVFMLAEGRCFNEFLGASVYGIHVFDIGNCPDDLEFTQTIFGSGGQARDCYGTLTVSESTDRLFAIDYCTDDAHPLPTVDIYDTGTLEFLGSVPLERAGGAPLMISVGHLATDEE